MRTKKEVYKKEQDEIIHKIISIVGIEDNTQITLYELDNDIKKQKEIMNLIPDIRKYFSFNNLKAVGEPERIKRPWLSIMKQLTKEKYKLTNKHCRLYQDGGKVIRTMNYTFTKIYKVKNCNILNNA